MGHQDGIRRSVRPVDDKKGTEGQIQTRRNSDKEREKGR